MSNSIPKIRFKGFTHAWEQRTLGECCKNTFSGGTPSTTNDEFWNGDIPWVQSSDISEHDIKNLNLRKYITKRGLKNSAAKLIPSNSIAIVTRVGVGKLNVIPFEYATSQDFLSLSNLNVDIWFGVYAIYKKIQMELSSVQGTSIKGITKNELLDKTIYIPGESEQTAIGNFFRTLDDAITLYKRKLDGLKELKRGYLQQMFPQAGESLPRVRFAGFAEPWQERKLGDVVERVQGNDRRMELPTLTISAGGGWLDQRERFSNNIAGKEQESYTLLSKGELSYNRGNSKLAKYGVVFELKTYEEALVPRVYHSFKPTHESIADFLEYMFATKIPDGELAKLITSGARMDGLLNIGFESFVGIKIHIPSRPEQTVIGNFFRNLDAQIAAQQQKLSQLKQLKAVYLQKMFV